MSKKIPILTLKRTLFQESIRRLQRTEHQWSGPVGLDFADQTLRLSWGASCELVPATGWWPAPTHVPSGWLRALSNAFPATDTVTIRIEDGCVITGTFSCSVVAPREQSELIDAKDRERRIAKAAGALKAFRVGEADLEQLINESEQHSERRRYGPAEERILKGVAEAWISLAVFGVSTDEIYRMIQQQVRNAWGTAGSRD